MSAVLAVILGCLVSQAQGATAQADDRKGSFWELKSVDGDKGVKYVYISDDAKGVSVTDLQTSTTVKGTKRANGDVAVDLKKASDRNAWGVTDLTLGPLSNDKATGTMTLAAGKTVSIHASKLPSLWACSHADPTHVAKSSQEMRDATTKYACVGWHKVEAPK